jgi:hypothetical protein
MKSEQAFYQKLRPLLPGLVTRIENYMIPGMPDVVVCHKCTTLWIELKVPEPLILLRKEQYAWNRRCASEGGRCFIFALQEPRMALWRYPMFSIEPYGKTSKYVRVISPPFYLANWIEVPNVITNLFPA